jgi:hypothetical protein
MALSRSVYAARLVQNNKTVSRPASRPVRMSSLRFVAHFVLMGACGLDLSRA